jgi:hypothetical protein
MMGAQEAPMRAVALILALAACGGPANPDPEPDTDADTVEANEANQDGACTFNRDCPADQRCACAEGDCACADGPRGTGLSGEDTCESGDDCASSLCLEGADDVLTCSGPCVDEGDCGPLLPVCARITGLGPVCIREAP